MVTWERMSISISLQIKVSPCDVKVTAMQKYFSEHATLKKLFASCILLQTKLLDLSSSFSFILKFTPGSKTKQRKRKKLGKDWFIPVISFALLKILCVPLYNLSSVFLSQSLPPYMRMWVVDGKQRSNDQSFRVSVTEAWVFAMLPISLWPHESYLGCPAWAFLNLNKNNIMIAFMKVK